LSVCLFDSERAGWIPTFGDLTYNLAAQYGWIYGLSVTEMEIVHGAYRKCNPNGKLIVPGRDIRHLEKRLSALAWALSIDTVVFLEFLKSCQLLFTLFTL
jgi:hypothetical protein